METKAAAWTDSWGMAVHVEGGNYIILSASCSAAVVVHTCINWEKNILLMFKILSVAPVLSKRQEKL